MFRLVAFLILSSISVPSFSNTTNDWTPFFKSWENACDFTNQLEKLYSDMVPKVIWPKEIPDIGSNQKIPIILGKISLPKNYKSLVNGKLITTFGSTSKNEKSYLTLVESGYAHSRFDVKGSYRDMPISRIGSYDGIENGIKSYYFIIDLPIVQVAKKMKPYISYSYSSDYVDSYDGELGMHLVKLNNQKTIVECDFSN